MLVDRERIELPNPPCKRGVIPFHQRSKFGADDWNRASNRLFTRQVLYLIELRQHGAPVPRELLCSLTTSDSNRTSRLDPQALPQSLSQKLLTLGAPCGARIHVSNFSGWRYTVSANEAYLLSWGDRRIRTRDLLGHNQTCYHYTTATIKHRLSMIKGEKSP